MAFSRPLLHFDSFGPVETVLHDIDARIPHVFPEHASHFIAALKKMVRQHSAQHGWQTVVLTVSQGMPEEELEDFLNLAPTHRGPVVIDPTLVNPHEKIYGDAEAVQADRENLAMLCQCSDDVLAVLYGVDGIDRRKSVQLLQARLRMMDMSFDMLKTDIAPDPRAGATPATLENVKRLQLARNVLGELNAVLDSSISQNLDPDGNAVSGAIMSARNELAFIMTHGAEPQLLHNLHVSDQQLQNIPFQFRELNLEPFFEAPMVKPHAPAPHPAMSDLRRILYDEMNPKPKMD